MNQEVSREMTDAELHGIIGGLSGSFQLSKLARSASVVRARSNLRAVSRQTMTPTFPGSVPATSAPSRGGCAGGKCSI